jgi:hypothetical protein
MASLAGFRGSPAPRDVDSDRKAIRVCAWAAAGRVRAGVAPDPLALSARTWQPGSLMTRKYGRERCPPEEVPLEYGLSYTSFAG